MAKFTNKQLADAIINTKILRTGEDLRDLLKKSSLMSRRLENSTWFRICKLIFPEKKDPRSISKYVNRIFLRLRNNFNEIQSIIFPKASSIKNKCLKCNGQNSQKNIEYKFTNEWILVPKHFWSTFTNTDGKLKSGWTDEFNLYFEKIYKFCVLTLMYKKFKKCGPKISFVAVGRCRHSTCTKFKFIYFDDNTNEESKIKVYRTSAIKHLEGENHRRFFRGRKRFRLSDQLKSSSAVKVRYNALGAIEESKLMNGNLNDVPSMAILHKISSDRRSQTDLSRDEHSFILNLIHNFKGKYKGKLFNNFIQEYTTHPFKIVLFTEEQLRVLLASQKRFCYLDSTGSITISECNKNLYYYALILPGNESKSQSFPVAEFISSVHAVPYITAFLLLISYRLRQMSSRLPAIDKIETDFSLALLQSVSLAFNKMSLIDYVNACFCDSNRIHQFTILHICSSHMLKTALRQIKKINLKGREKQIAIRAIVNLIHSDNLSEALHIFEILLKIFVFKESDKSQEECIQIIAKFTPSFINIQDLVQKHSEEEESEDKYESKKDVTINLVFSDTLTRKDSYYFKKFSEVYERLKKHITPCRNTMYCLILIEYLMNYWLPYYPLWSAVVIKNFRLLRDSNSSVENWHRIIKYSVLLKEKNIKIPRFIQVQEQLLQGRLVERSHSLLTEREKQKRSLKSVNKSDIFSYCTQEGDTGLSSNYDREDETAEEYWNRKNKYPKSIENKYFKFQRNNKFVSNSENQSFIKTNQSVSQKIMEEGRIVSLSFSRNNKYPNNLSELKTTIDGYVLDNIDFMSLKKNHWLTDNVINAFAAEQTQIARSKGLSVIFLETLLTSAMIEGTISHGFKNWLADHHLLKYDCWILPLNLNNVHWSLLIVDVRSKIILNLDSFHIVLETTTMNKILSCLNIFSSEDVSESNSGLNFFEGWKFYAPTDITKQKDGNSCGVYICIWIYMICNSINISFSHSDSIYARSSIIQILLNANQHENRSRISQDEIRRKLFENIDADFLSTIYREITFIRAPPENCNSTAEYCSNLLYSISP